MYGCKIVQLELYCELCEEGGGSPHTYTQKSRFLIHADFNNYLIELSGWIFTSHQLNWNLFWWAAMPFLPSNQERKEEPRAFACECTVSAKCECPCALCCMNGGCMCWSQATWDTWGGNCIFKRWIGKKNETIKCEWHTSSQGAPSSLLPTTKMSRNRFYWN